MWSAKMATVLSRPQRVEWRPNVGTLEQPIPSELFYVILSKNTLRMHCTNIMRAAFILLSWMCLDISLVFYYVISHKHDWRPHIKYS